MFLNLLKLQTLWEFHGRLKPAAGLGAPQMIQDGTVLMAVAMQTWILMYGWMQMMEMTTSTMQFLKTI